MDKKYGFAAVDSAVKKNKDFLGWLIALLLLIMERYGLFAF